MTIADEIERLQRLKEAGAITEEEFVQAKRRVLGEALPEHDRRTPADPKQQTREWAVFLHLSQLLGFLIPFGGLVAPLLIWQLKKAELPGLDDHGKAVMNWVLSALIYFLGAALLTIILVGIPLLIVVIVLAVIFPIIGAVKASNGEVWPYPLSIRFFS